MGNKILRLLESGAPATRLIPLLLAAGALLRIVVWWQNRSLFHDEANLAHCYCEQGWAGLFGPLGRGQYAPPFFSVIVKAAATCFGQRETALRLFPLLCGLTSLGLFYRLGRRLIQNHWALSAAVWIFSFSEILIRYATECKPYGCDVTVALALATWAMWQYPRPFRPVTAALAGAGAIWLSMPSVFVLFGIAVVFLKKARAEKQVPGLLSVLVAWALSFGAYYFLNLRASLADPNLADSHSPWMLPLLPASTAEWRQIRDLLLAFPYYTAGYTAVALGTGALGILSGIRVLSGRHAPAGALLLLPVAACLLASGLHRYSLIPRLLLWSFPLVLLVQAAGWAWWWDSAHRYLRPVWLLLWAACAGLQTGGQYFFNEYVLEDIRPVLAEVRADFKENDLLYVHVEARAAVSYYRDCHERRADFRFYDRVLYADWNTQPDSTVLTSGRPELRRVWLVYGHVVSDVTRQAMEADRAVIGGFARQIRAAERPGAYAFLYEIK